MMMQWLKFYVTTLELKPLLPWDKLAEVSPPLICVSMGKLVLLRLVMTCTFLGQFLGLQSAQGGSSLSQAEMYLIRLISRMWIFNS